MSEENKQNKKAEIIPADKEKKAVIDHRKRAMAWMTAIGFSKQEIAQELGINPKNVAKIMSSQSYRREISKIQDQIYKEPTKVFQKILPKAIKVAHEIMTNEEEKSAVRLDAAFKFMDRSLGKPTQRVEHTGNLLAEVFAKLDNQMKDPGVRTIEVSSRNLDSEETVIEVGENESEESKDELDQWVTKNIPKL